MSMQVTLPLLLDREMFSLEEAARAEALAESTAGQVYCWKTSGRENWLEAGFSIADVLGLVVLPQGLPSQMDMADDAEDDDQ